MKFLRHSLAALLLFSCQPAEEKASQEKATAEKPHYPQLEQMTWLCDRNSPSLRGEVDVLGTKLTRVWEKKLQGGVYSSAVIENKVLYITDEEGYFYALNLLDGEIIWQMQLKQAVFSPLLLVGDFIYFGDMDGVFTALNKKTQSIAWQKQEKDEKITGGTNISPDGKTLVYGSYDFHLYGLERVTGKELFRIKTANYINGTPAIVQNRVLFGGCDHYLRIADLSTGKEEVKTKLSSHIPNSVATDQELAYAACYDGAVQALTLEGKEHWIYQSKNKGASYETAPAINDKYLVAAEKNGVVNVLNKSKGDLLGSFTTEGDIETSPIIDKKRALVCDNDGTVYIFDLETQEQLLKHRYGTTISAPLIADEGFLLLCDENGRVSLFKMEGL